MLALVLTMAHSGGTETRNRREEMQATTYTIDAVVMKLFGKKATIYRLLKSGEVVGVYETKAEAEAAQAAL